MTWTNVTSTGSGKVALALVIEGMPTIWVTDSALEGNGTDDRRKRVGFIGGSFSFSERADITSSKVQAEGFTAQIDDIGEYATAEFTQLPAAITWLTQDLTVGGTTIHVRSTAGWVANETIHVGTECMTITSITNSTTAVIARGKRDTIAQAHYTSDGVNLRSPEVTTRPTGIEGRRAYVYALGDAETGNGTRIFAGVCSSDASLVDATTWQITIDPITTLLDQSVGKDAGDPVSPRGIHYFADNGITLSVTRLSGATQASTATSDVFYATFGAQFTNGTAFFETQAEFVEWLNALIVTESSGWSVPLTANGTGSTPCLQAVVTADGGWNFQYRTGSTAYWLEVVLLSQIDNIGPGGVPWNTVSGTPGGTLTTNTTYIRQQNPSGVARGLGQVPRGYFNTLPGISVATPLGYAFERRLYLGGAVDVNGADQLSIEWPSTFSYDGDTTNHIVVSPDTATRSLAVMNYDSDRAADATFHFWTPAYLPRITFSRVVANGSIYDFLADITTNSPTYANAGGMPLLTSADVNLSEFNVNVTEAAGGVAFLTNRIYPQTTKPQKLSDILSPELLMLGLVPCMDEAGKLSFRKFRVRAATDSIDADITASSELDLPGWERATYGSINDVTIKTGYNPAQDKYDGITFRIRDVGSYSRNKLSKKLTIEPKSYYNSRVDAGVTNAIIEPILEPIIGLLGYPYDLITIPVPLSMYNVIIGDVVTYTSNKVPDTGTGARGVTSVVGLVVGREWKPYEAQGRLTILVTLQRIAGYSPTSRVLSETNVAGNTWDLNIAAGSQPTGYAGVSKWAAGYKVQVENIDSSSPTVRTGTVASVNTGAETVRVTFDSAWVPGASTWNLDFMNSDTASMPAAQQVYCFEAAATGAIDMGATDATARTFAP